MARRPSKNALCPCGSGKRYKSCCLKTQQQQHTATQEIHTENAVIGRVVHEMTRWFDALPEAAKKNVATDITFDSGQDLLRQWAVLDRLGGRDPGLFSKTLRVLDVKLAKESGSLLAQQDSAFIGLWEVLRHDADGVRLREGLTGAKMSLPFSLLPALHVHDHLMMRAVRRKGTWVPTAWTQTALPPRASFILVEQLRLGLPQVSPVPEEGDLSPAHLAHADARYAVLRLGAGSWQLLTTHRVEKTLDTGEISSTVFDRYRLLGQHRDVSLRQLMALNPAEMSSGNEQIVQWSDVDGSAWIGEARLDGDHLTVLAPSVVHADRLRRQLETSFGDHLSHLDRQEQRESRRLLDLIQDGVSWDLDPNAPEEVRNAIAAALEQRWQSWPDLPHASLDKKSPRQALATKSGQKRVRNLINIEAWSESQRPEWQRYGMNRVRHALGLHAPDANWNS